MCLTPKTNPVGDTPTVVRDILRCVVDESFGFVLQLPKCTQLTPSIYLPSITTCPTQQCIITLPCPCEFISLSGRYLSTVYKHSTPIKRGYFLAYAWHGMACWSINPLSAFLVHVRYWTFTYFTAFCFTTRLHVSYLRLRFVLVEKFSPWAKECSCGHAI